MEDSDSTLPGTTAVSYGGTVIAKLESGRTATIKCARKRMKADITVTAGVGGGKRMTANASVVDVVSDEIILDMTPEAKAGVVDVISARVNLKRPNLTTNLIVEVNE